MRYIYIMRRLKEKSDLIGTLALDACFIMIDGCKDKVLSLYDDIPNVACNCATDIKRIHSVLNSVHEEMIRRLRLFRDSGVRDVEAYNSLGSNDHSGEISKLEHIVVVIRDLSSLSLYDNAWLTKIVVSILQLGHVAGIHLVAACNCLYHEDAWGDELRGRFNGKVLFHLSPGNSFYDNNPQWRKAKYLLGNGDMLYIDSFKTNMTRIQGACVTLDDVRRVVEYLKSKKKKEHCKVKHDKTLLFGAKTPEIFTFHSLYNIISKDWRCSAYGLI